MPPPPHIRRLVAQVDEIDFTLRESMEGGDGRGRWEVKSRQFYASVLSNTTSLSPSPLSPSPLSPSPLSPSLSPSPAVSRGSKVDVAAVRREVLPVGGAEMDEGVHKMVALQRYGTTVYHL
jgi:hypothetical protein